MVNKSISKICTKCKLEKPLNKFYNCKIKKDGKRGDCVECCRIEHLNYKNKNREEYRKSQREWYKKNRPRLIKERAKYRKNNRDSLRKMGRDWNRKLNEKIFLLFGQICVCCGETNVKFLSLDHKKNDGNKDRKMGISNMSIKIKLLKGLLDKNDYQIMCMNCNWGRRLNGICPHKEN